MLTNPLPLAPFLQLKHRAIGTNLSIPRSLHSHSSQLGNGIDEVGVEDIGITGKRIDSGLGPGVREEDLIGGKQTLPLLKILVVDIVECSRSGGVHVDGYPWIHVPGAHGLELARVLLVQCWVHGAARAEVEYSIGEPAAMAESQGVCAC